MLIAAGLDVKELATDGSSAIHCAAKSVCTKQLSIAEILMDAGVSSNVSRSDGKTALHVLCGNVRQSEVHPSTWNPSLQLLLSNHADPELVDTDGSTALHELCSPDLRQVQLRKAFEPSSRAAQTFGRRTVPKRHV